jgi:ubiquinone/menaquinone biosynthesis C-methylase UbiE
MTTSVGSSRAAYDAASATWDQGPNVVYARLAEALLVEAPTDLAGQRVLDLGAGSGVVSTMVTRRGGRPTGLDESIGMTRATLLSGTPSVQGDAASLPFRAGAFDVVIAAFVLNHLADPAAALRQIRRVLRPGGLLLASTFAAGPDHPVKGVVDGLAAELGWRPPAWYRRFKAGRADRVADPDALAAMARAAGFARVVAKVRTVDVGRLDAATLVEYRLGMGSLAEFAGRLPAADRAALVARAAEHLGPLPAPLGPAVLMLSAAPGAPMRLG